MRLCIPQHVAQAGRRTAAATLGTRRVNGGQWPAVEHQRDPFHPPWGAMMRLPTLWIARGFQPFNLAGCSARAQRPRPAARYRPSPLRGAWRGFSRLVASGKFAHPAAPGHWIAPTKP